MLAGFLAVCEARAVAVQLEDVDVMGQPVEPRASQPFGAEDRGDLASRRRDRGPAPRVRGRRSQCWPSRATRGSILSRFVVAELRRQASQ